MQDNRHGSCRRDYVNITLQVNGENVIYLGDLDSRCQGTARFLSKIPFRQRIGPRGMRNGLVVALGVDDRVNHGQPFTYL